MHACKAVVVHCIDFRFRKMLNDYLMSRFPEGYDLISVAGGVKNLDFVAEQLKISDRLHKPEIVVVIQHEDCGAYGGSKRFQSIEQELDFQRQELQKAKVLLAKHFPDKSVETYCIRLSRGVDPVDLDGVSRFRYM